MTEDTSGLLDKKFQFSDPKALQNTIEVKERSLESLILQLESSKEKLRSKKYDVDQINLKIKMIVKSKNGEQLGQNLEELENFTKNEVSRMQGENTDLQVENGELEIAIGENKTELKNAESESLKVHKNLKNLLIKFDKKRNEKNDLENKIVQHKIENVESRRTFNLTSETFKEA
jgi:chromosome segregation ATPase